MSGANGRAAGAVPLRRRLAARLAAAIQDGRPPPGRRLPGIRDLAGRLGVHRHTVAAAYGELAASGLVVTIPGSGTYVADAAGPLRTAARASGRSGGQRENAATLFRAFLAGQRAGGASVREVEELVRRWARQVAAERLLLVEPEDGLRRLLLHELGRALPRRVEPLSPLRLRRSPSLALRGIPLARPAVLSAVVRALPAGAEALPLHLSGGARELRMVRRLRDHSVVALVTESEALRQRARELMATARERGTGLLLPRPDDAVAVARTLRIARLVFADALCARRPPLVGRRRLVEIRVLPAAALTTLRGWLAAPGTESGRSGRKR